MPAPPLFIHWLRLVIPHSDHAFSEIEQMFPTRSPRPGGLWGWYDRSEWTLDRTAIIAWASSPARAAKEGILLELTGQACAKLGTDLHQLSAHLLSIKAHATRLDIAFDDADRHLVKERIIEHERRDHLVTRYRTSKRRARMTVTSQRDRGHEKAWSIMFGSPASHSHVIIYDKHAERAEGPARIRFEFRTHDALAQTLLLLTIAQDSPAIRSIIDTRLRFVAPPRNSQDTNRRRWPPSTWWAAIMPTVSIRDLLIPTPPQDPLTIEDLRRWFRSAAAPTAATILQADASFLWLRETIEHATYRIKPAHRVALQNMVQLDHAKKP